MTLGSSPLNILEIFHADVDGRIFMAMYFFWWGMSGYVYTVSSMSFRDAYREDSQVFGCEAI